MANSPDRGRHWKLYEFGANGEFGIQADKTISTPGIEKRRHRMDESRGRPQVAIGHMWLKVSDISRAAQYFVSLGLRPFIRGKESRYWSCGEVHIWYCAPPTSRFQREQRPLST